MEIPAELCQTALEVFRFSGLHVCRRMTNLQTPTHGDQTMAKNTKPKINAEAAYENACLVAQDLVARIGELLFDLPAPGNDGSTPRSCGRSTPKAKTPSPQMKSASCWCSRFAGRCCGRNPSSACCPMALKNSMKSALAEFCVDY
jgi:hypothetical protein